MFILGPYNSQIRRTLKPFNLESFWTLKASNLVTGTALVFLTCQLFSEGFIWIVIAKWLVKIIWKLLNRRKSSKLLLKKSLKNSGPNYLKSWPQIKKRWLKILKSWLQIPLNLALSTCNVGPNCRKGHVAEQQKCPLGGSKMQKYFFQNWIPIYNSNYYLPSKNAPTVDFPFNKPLSRL